MIISRLNQQQQDQMYPSLAGVQRQETPPPNQRSNQIVKMLQTCSNITNVYGDIKLCP